jgi:NitT/TauT family transport system ATP-binding protein
LAEPNDGQAEGMPQVRQAASVSSTNAETAPRAEAADPLITFDHVTKLFGEGENRVHVVDDVSFVARRGEFISILGPSGCGKSTMLMLTSGLIPVSSGVIEIDGIRVTEPYTDLGIVFQQDLLMDWRRVQANILVQAEFRGLRVKDYEKRARELLNLVGLTGCEEKYPFELSGGMRQRVAICRALIHNPNLLLMDEPFGSLDALTRDQMNLDLQRIWYENKKTVLFVTHSIPEAVFLGDRVFVMAPSPTRIRESIKISLPRPRHLEVRETPEFAAYIHRITQLFYQMGILRS